MNIPSIVDTHVHLWDLSRFRYPWLEAEEYAPIRSNYLPSDLVADISSLDVRALVHVQADIDHELDPVEETAWLASLSESAPRGFPRMVCVPYADLRSPDLDDILVRHTEYEFVRGIRQEVWFDPESTLSEVLQTNLLDDPAWVSGLKRLAEHDLSFDLLVSAPQLSQGSSIFRDIPDVPVIIDHSGAPVLKDGRLSATWLEGLQQFAREVPNAVIKISWMGFIRSAWAVSDIEDVVCACIDIFGPSRCAFGSNYPVERPDSSYERLWEAYAEITNSLSASERFELFEGTATRFYRITTE